MSLISELYLDLELENFDLRDLGLGKSLARADLILAALFLWIVCFLEALSAREIAFKTASLEGCLRAALTAISSLEMIDLLIFAFWADPLKALLAVFVTGIRIV